MLPPSSPHHLAPKQHRYNSIDALYFESKTPPTKDRRRAALFLHGVGANMYDLVPAFLPLPCFAEDDLIFFNAPHHHHPLDLSGRSWFAVESIMAQLTAMMAQGRDHIIVEAVKSLRLPADYEHSYRSLCDALTTMRPHYSALAMVGFSQGGMMALDLALSELCRHNGTPLQHLGLFSTVIASPRIFDCLAQLPAHSSPLAIFQTHGEHDPVLPFQWGQESYHVLRPHFSQLYFRPFQDQHTIPRSIAMAWSAWMIQTRSESLLKKKHPMESKADP